MVKVKCWLYMANKTKHGQYTTSNKLSLDADVWWLAVKYFHTRLRVLMLIGRNVILIKEWALFKLLQQSLRQTEKLNIVCLGTNSSILHLVYQMFCHSTLGSAWPKSSTLEQLQTSEKTRNKPCWWIMWSLNIKSQSQNTYSLLSYTPPTPPHPPPPIQMTGLQSGPGKRQHRPGNL